MTAFADITGLYASHVAEIRLRYEQALARARMDAVVVGSGVLQYRYLDDQAQRYVASPHFLQWIPLQEHPGSAVVLTGGRRPVLIVNQPDDYWHQPPALPEPFIAREFDVEVIRNPAELTAHLPGPDWRTAFVGPPDQWEGVLPEAPRNPEPLLNYLHYHRARKTPWEVGCVRRAATMAAPGHSAAELAFRNGGSEYEILIAFLGGCRQLEPDLPYAAIVALNEHGATLHYQHRARDSQKPGDLHSLLIDAGCAFNGYASDITRTYAYGDGEFAAMVADMDDLQQQLCRSVRPGVSFPELHRQTHRGVAELLRRWDIVRMTPEEIVDAGVTSAFFPHGLGHLLGIQVHDVGGHMADENGTRLSPPPDFPKLRFLRPLEAGHIVTIEPGIYFIESLLSGLRGSRAANCVNWEKVADIQKYGGIRIEDDVLVTENGCENLTRPLLPS